MVYKTQYTTKPLIYTHYRELLYLLVFVVFQLRNRKDNEERVDQLQKSYLNLQAATEKREQVEQRLRTSLQEEVRTLRAKVPAYTLTVNPELSVS